MIIFIWTLERIIIFYIIELPRWMCLLSYTNKLIAPDTLFWIGASPVSEKEPAGHIVHPMTWTTPAKMRNSTWNLMSSILNRSSSHLWVSTGKLIIFEINCATVYPCACVRAPARGFRWVAHSTCFHSNIFHALNLRQDFVVNLKHTQNSSHIQWIWWQRYTIFTKLDTCSIGVGSSRTLRAVWGRAW